MNSLKPRQRATCDTVNLEGDFFINLKQVEQSEIDSAVFVLKCQFKTISQHFWNSIIKQVHLRQFKIIGFTTICYEILVELQLLEMLSWRGAYNNVTVMLP